MLAMGINRTRYPLTEALLSAFDAEDASIPYWDQGEYRNRRYLTAAYVGDLDGWRSMEWRTRPHWHPPYPAIPSIFA